MDKKHIKNYWKEVMQRSFRPVWEEMTMRVLIIGLTLLLLSAGVSGILLMLDLIPNDFFVNRVAEAQAGISAFCVSLGVFTILFVISVYKTPVKMHEELGGFIENPFDLNQYYSKRERKDDEDRWVSILVKNISPSEDVEECFLELKDIVDLKTGKSIIQDIQNLTWSGREQSKEIMGNQPISIVASYGAVCDVARTDKKNLWGDSVYYTTWFGRQKIDEGSYLLEIVVHGNFKDHSIHYTYQSVLRFTQPDNFKLDKPVLIGK